MGIYSNNRIFSLNEDAVISNVLECSMMDFLIESHKNEYEVFETVIGCDFYEAYCEAGMIPIDEDAKSGKMKDAIKKVIGKIKDLFKSFISKLKQLGQNISKLIKTNRDELARFRSNNMQKKLESQIGKAKFSIEYANAVHDPEELVSRAMGIWDKKDMDMLQRNLTKASNSLKSVSKFDVRAIDKAYETDIVPIEDLNKEFQDDFDKFFAKESTESEFTYTKDIHDAICMYLNKANTESAAMKDYNSLIKDAEALEKTMFDALKEVENDPETTDLEKYVRLHGHSIALTKAIANIVNRYYSGMRTGEYILKSVFMGVTGGKAFSKYEKPDAVNYD